MPNPELEKFSRQVVEAMPLMLREFARREDNDLTRGKISVPQMVTLHQVSQKGRVSMSEIAKTLSIKTSSASVLVDRLVRAKMLSRLHDREDRRVIWVRITAKGRKVVDQIMRTKRASVKQIFGSLTAKERSQYLSALLKVKSHLLKSTAAACLVAFGLVFLAQEPASAFGWSFFKRSPAAQKSQAPAPSSLTLPEAYQLALKRSESLAISAEEIQQAQARFYRAFEYFLPSVHFQIYRTDQDGLSNAGGEGLSSDAARKSKHENKFTFSQPLFSGFKEFAALKASGADKKEQRLKYERAKELLFGDVMDAFYSLLQNEKDVRVLYGIHRAMTGRLKDLDARIRLGRSRDSEKLTSLTDLRLVESDLIDAKNAVRLSRNLLEFYIGQSLAARPPADEARDFLLPDLSECLQKAVSRKDVQADAEALVVAEQGIVKAQADLFPTISAEGNYYTRRVGFQNGNDWDVTVKMDVPVFDPGPTLGDLKEAAATKETARLQFAQTGRMAELDVRNAHEDFRSALESETALRKAGEAASKNYEVVAGEYRTNLVSNLDVLDALRRSKEIQQRYNQAYYQSKKSYWKLKVALGEVL